MSSKRFILLIILVTILYMKKFLIIASIYFQIFALIFVFILRYIHKKFILFCKEKLEKEHKEKLNFSDKKKTFCSKSPFLDACKRGDTKLIEQLINSGVNIFETDENGDGAIHYAVYHLINNNEIRHVKFLWVLHNAGCPINLKNVEGITPLYLAARNGHVSLIKWLVRKGADINIKPLPFVGALDAGQKQAAALLLAIKYKLTKFQYT